MFIFCVIVGAVYLAAGFGVLRIFPVSPDVIGDVVPVDYVVSTILLAAVDVMKKVSDCFRHAFFLESIWFVFRELISSYTVTIM